VQGGCLEDISNKRLVDVFNAGINKGRITRLSGGSNEPQNEALNGPLNETLNQLSVPVKAAYDAIRTNPGIRRAGIVAHSGLNLPAVKRAITILLSKELIEHRGSDKTGGYYAK